MKNNKTIDNATEIVTLILILLAVIAFVALVCTGNYVEALPLLGIAVIGATYLHSPGK